MITDDAGPFSAVPAALVPALLARGFTELTSVQKAVLDPELAERDLRISSRTGSGKTVAFGFLISALVEKMFDQEAERSTAALILAPTRELAVQVAGELRWLLEPMKVRVACVTGGTSVMGDKRALANKPEVIVGTPGRMLDHLNKGSIDPSAVAMVVLDEADQMLDLGFRDDLEAILAKTPSERRTVLVSATFPRAVMSLAQTYQKNAVSVEGTALGSANEDIAHVVHPVRPDEMGPALVNLLLLADGERTLVFVRTRADAADVAERLVNRGFSARAISGDLEQRDRTRTLDAFRSGAVSILVATDVAARGLDVPDVAWVVHMGLPGDPEALTHRAGRTGRAGRKGTSVILTPPGARDALQTLLHRAKIVADIRPAPTAAEVQEAQEKKLEMELRAPPIGDMDARLRMLAARLLSELEPMALVYALLARADTAATCPPMQVTPLTMTLSGAPRERDGAGARFKRTGSYTTFRITMGEKRGADPRRILAIVCRRGGVTRTEVGAIRLGPEWSTFEVKSENADAFFERAGKPDAQDPRVRIDRFLPRGPARAALKK